MLEREIKDIMKRQYDEKEMINTNFKTPSQKYANITLRRSVRLQSKFTHLNTSEDSFKLNDLEIKEYQRTPFSVKKNTKFEDLRENKSSFRKDSNLNENLLHDDGQSTKTNFNINFNENKKPMKQNRAFLKEETAKDKMSSFSSLTIKKTPKKILFTHKKVPDFAAIHAQHFNKMESIVEHAAKRADLAKVLSGKMKEKVLIHKHPVLSRIPRFVNAQIPQDLPKLKKWDNVFVFKGTNIIENSNKKLENKIEARSLKHKGLYKNRAQSEPKKREILKGVRSNRRFELQMKFRRAN